MDVPGQMSRSPSYIKSVPLLMAITLPISYQPSSTAPLSAIEISYECTRSSIYFLPIV